MNVAEIHTMNKEFSVVVERDEDGIYVASVPTLPGCHTQADTLDMSMERVKEAIALHLDNPSADAPSLELVGIQRVSVPA
jgi:predicted RNase H-like HicB family nuclease